MTRRIAASMALVAFTVCILVGLQAGNPVTTILSRSLVALFVTFFLGLVIGTMAQKMLDENLTRPPAVQNPANPPDESGGGDR